MATAKKTPWGWKIQAQVDGKRTAKTFPTKRGAEDWANGLRGDAVAEANEGPGATKTLRDAIERFRDKVSPTRKGHQKEFIRLNAYLNDRDAHPLPLDELIGRVTTDHMQDWITHRLTLNAPGTVLRDINLLAKVLSTSVISWKWIKATPMKGVIKPTEPEHRERTIEGWEQRRMLRRMNYNGKDFDTTQRRVAAAFLLAVFTGMRAGEITNLEWNRVYSNFADLTKTKTNPRKVILSAAARQLLARLNAVRSGELVLQGLNEKQLDSNFRKYREQLADMDDFDGDFVFHDSRHTAATALSQDMGMLDLCKTMGWKNPKHAMVYYNPKPDAMAFEYEARKLERHRRNQQQASTPTTVRELNVVQA